MGLEAGKLFPLKAGNLVTEKIRDSGSNLRPGQGFRQVTFWLSASMSEFAAAFHGFQHSNLICILDIAPGGDAGGNSCDFHARTFD